MRPKMTFNVNIPVKDGNTELTKHLSPFSFVSKFTKTSCTPLYFTLNFWVILSLLNIIASFIFLIFQTQTLKQGEDDVQFKMLT